MKKQITQETTQKLLKVAKPGTALYSAIVRATYGKATVSDLGVILRATQANSELEKGK